MAIVTISLVLPSVSAHAQGIPVIDVQSIAQEIMQVTHQVTQITNQMTQIQNQVTSLGNEAKMLTTLPLDFTADLAGALQQFQSVLQTAQGLSYTAMDTIAPFRALYPELYDQAMSVAQIASQGQQWISQTRRAIETATQAQNDVARAIAGTEARVSAAVSGSAGAVGQTQAIQAGNQILGELSSQLAGLQDLLITQARADQARLAQEAATYDQQDAIRQKLWSDYGQSGHLSTDPFQ